MMGDWSRDKAIVIATLALVGAEGGGGGIEEEESGDDSGKVGKEGCGCH